MGCYERLLYFVHVTLHSALTLKVLVTTIDAQWEGMADVGSARYEPALLPPCPTIRVLSYIVASKFSENTNVRVNMSIVLFSDEALMLSVHSCSFYLTEVYCVARWFVCTEYSVVMALTTRQRINLRQFTARSITLLIYCNIPMQFSTNEVLYISHRVHSFLLCIRCTMNKCNLFWWMRIYHYGKNNCT